MKKKFTLTELLLVITIISVLTSMLLPSLKKVRDKAWQTQCLNELKQIHFSSMNYAEDYSGYLIPCLGAGFMGRTSTTYWQQIFVYLGYIKPPADFVGSDGSLAAKGPAGIYACPSESLKNLEGKTEWQTWRGTHYGVNKYLNWTDVNLDDDKVWFKFLELPKPSRIAYWGDKAAGNTTSMSYTEDSIGKFRHNDGMNVYFADGHGEYRRRSSVPTYSTDPEAYKRIFWARRDLYHVTWE